MEDREKRLNEVARIAVSLETEIGCPARLLITQRALESQWGAKPAGHSPEKISAGGKKSLHRLEY